LNRDISDKDKKDWENFITSKERLPNKDFKKNSKSTIKSKIIDLHGFTLEEANLAVEKFINKSYQEKISKLIIVTGKGLHSDNKKNPYVSEDLSILKYSVPEFISKNKDLMKMINEIQDARIEDGGSGAFYIFLKQNKNK
tara:strand:- start:505 stop:924 length:420 start_codon:yes stop_codon:yes gene_type:complete